MTLAASLTSVRLEYDGRTALAGIDLDVAVGERVGLVGPSGAGKSSLLGLLSGMVRPTAGTVTALGTELEGLTARQLRVLRGGIATVHQRLDLAGPLRVVHNVNAGRLAAISRRKAVLDLARPPRDGAVADALDAVGLGDRYWSRTDELSGGERQRVAIARALVHRPRLLLADEPVASLDPALSAAMLDLLCDRQAPWTTIVSLHEPDLARQHCDRLVGLRDGEIVFDRAVAAVGPAEIDELYGQTAHR